MKIFELNIIDNETILKRLVVWNIVITILSIVPFYLLERLFSSGDPFYHQLTIPYIMGSIITVVAGSAVIIVIHEWVHGMFFKLFSAKSRVKYGYKSGMFYATAPGEIYHRFYFAVIIIMPFIIITTLLLIVLYFFDYTAVTVILVFHTGACAGDFYFLYLMFKHRDLKYVEDTETGITMYETKPEL